MQPLHQSSLTELYEPHLESGSPIVNRNNLNIFEYRTTVIFCPEIRKLTDCDCCIYC